MKTLEELLEENAILNDKRRKAFKELKNELINTYVPSLCKAMENSEKEATFFTLYSNPFDFSAEKDNAWEDEYYILCVKVDGTMREGYASGENNSVLKPCVYVEDKDIHDISSDCIVELCKRIKDKILHLNNQIASRTAEAEKLIINNTNH